MNRREMCKLVAIGGVGLAVGGCRGIPADTMRTVTVGAASLEASGAGIVKAGAEQTTFKIKCSVCGYESEPMTVQTPKAGQPYTLPWVCPRCGHKQKIVIQVAG